MSIFIEYVSLRFYLLLIISLSTTSQQTCKSGTHVYPRSLSEKYQLMWGYCKYAISSLNHLSLFLAKIFKSKCFSTKNFQKPPKTSCFFFYKVTVPMVYRVLGQFLHKKPKNSDYSIQTIFYLWKCCWSEFIHENLELTETGIQLSHQWCYQET